jgi:hypothetical protein
VDRKTARRYVNAAIEVGLDGAGGEEQLTDVLVGEVVEKVRPQRRDGRGRFGGCLRATRTRSGPGWTMRT